MMESWVATKGTSWVRLPADWFFCGKRYDYMVMNTLTGDPVPGTGLGGKARA